MQFKNIITMVIVILISFSTIEIQAIPNPNLGTLDESIFVSAPTPLPSNPSLGGTRIECEVIINGGSMSALFAAIASAKENVSTCLLEPTDWVGGQLTASGVPAIDWQWMTNSQGVDIKAAHALRENSTFLFWDWIKAIGNPGKCTVSRNCYMPLELLDKYIKPYLATLPNLKIHYNTVVKSVDKAKAGTSYDTFNAKNTDVNQIKFVNAITRTPNSALAYKGYDKRLSEDLPDWYAITNSARFTKQIKNFTGVSGALPIVIEASEFTDVMVLSGAEYMQGNQLFDGTKATLNEQCGQGITYPFNMKYHSSPKTENGPQLGTFPRTSGAFNSSPYGWDGVWRYRRLNGGNVPGKLNKALPGEVTVMNWTSMLPSNGNDYSIIYPFKTYANTAKEITNWAGGLNMEAIKGAEDLSYDFYYWFKEQSPTKNSNQFTMDKDSMQSGTGLYKFPYFRDIRRSVGIDNFMLKTTDTDAQNPTGYRFADRVAITSYPSDIHPTANCKFSNDDLTLNDVLGPKEEPTGVFIPFRSLTNRTTANMLVAGKAISQTLKAGAATRLQPGEAETGTAAGVSAAYMAKNKIKNVYDLVQGRNGKTYTQSIGEIQKIIKKYQNIDWTIKGKVYPAATEKLKKVKFMYLCPTQTTYDEADGTCNTVNDSYGAFTNVMQKECKTIFKLGDQCTNYDIVPSNNMTVRVNKLPKLTTRKLRKTGECPAGSAKDRILTDFCVEGSGDNKVLYGPFTYSEIRDCLTLLKGGDACYSTKLKYDNAKGWINR